MSKNPSFSQLIVLKNDCVLTLLSEIIINFTHSVVDKSGKDEEEMQEEPKEDKRPNKEVMKGINSTAHSFSNQDC